MAGTAESTFSFRIREDRQLMGFSKESTFNQLCGRRADGGGDHTSCATPTYWEMPREVAELWEETQERHAVASKEKPEL